MSLKSKSKFIIVPSVLVPKTCARVGLPAAIKLVTGKLEELLKSFPKGTFKGIIPVDFAGRPVDLEKLRNVYFNRLKTKLNFRAFLDFYSWFDSTISNFIEQLLPRKTVYKGTNFLIESHVLERHKHEYYSSEIYIGEADRNRIKDVLLLQQIVGTFRKY